MIDLGRGLNLLLPVFYFASANHFSPVAYGTHMPVKGFVQQWNKAVNAAMNIASKTAGYRLVY